MILPKNIRLRAVILKSKTSRFQKENFVKHQLIRLNPDTHRTSLNQAEKTQSESLQAEERLADQI